MATCKLFSTMANSTAMYHITTMTYINIVPAIFVILSNALCLVTLIKTPSLQTPSNVLVGGLCISDLLIGIIVQPLFIVFLVLFQHGFVEWKIIEIPFLCGARVSFILLHIVTLDRYIAICHPYKYNHLATFKTHYYLTAIAYGFVLEVPFLELYPHWFNLAFAIGGQLCFLPLLGFCYAAIYRVIRKQRKVAISIGTIEGEDREKLGKQKAEKDQTNTIAIILGVFLICYYPILGVNVAKWNTPRDICDLPSNIFVADLWSKTMVLFNSAINPVVYSLRIKVIRDAGLRIIRRNMRFLGFAASDE
eukprot:Seg1944.2 transcript_id=Seg1944.2/GoldUCD/mRNA.D3Y31 product="Beta-1 adrenergic receptor" protein_id=Seg1944.2/GoldUCD/D3Y31